MSSPDRAPTIADVNPGIPAEDQGFAIMNRIANSRAGRFLTDITLAMAVIIPGGAATMATPASADSAPNVPTLPGEQFLPSARASDTSSSEEQECVQAGTAAPQVLQRPIMFHAGIRPTQDIVGIKYAQHHPPEAVEGRFEYPTLAPPLTSVDCSPDYLRVIGGRFYLEKADVRGNPGDPIKEPKNWTNLTYQWGALGVITDPTTNKLAPSDQGGVNSVGHLMETLAPSFFNQCINGKFLQVDYVARDIVRAAATKQKVGEAYHIYKAKVHGNCDAAAKSARMTAHYQHSQ